MWQYQKRLQYPVNIKSTNPRLAQFIVAQYGGAYCKSFMDFLFKIALYYLFCMHLFSEYIQIKCVNNAMMKNCKKCG